MILSKITSTTTNQMTDFLGEGGTERHGIYPGVTIAMYDEDTEEILGVVTHYLRPGSAFETMDDVKADIQQRIAKMTAEQNNPTPEPQPLEVTEEAQAKLDEIDKLMGQDITTADLSMVDAS